MGNGAYVPPRLSSTLLVKHGVVHINLPDLHPIISRWVKKSVDYGAVIRAWAQYQHESVRYVDESVHTLRSI
jgi:hypothetical protein